MNTVLNKAGKKLFEKNLEQYAPADPLYEYYTDARGKQKRRKRELPPGLSKRDARILRSVKKRAHYLDKGFSLCGLRFGWTFFIGLIPIAGDAADLVLNYVLVVRPAQRADIPPWLLRRMLLNNAANSRNVALLEEFLRIRGEEFIKMSGGTEHPEDRKTKTGISGWFGGGKKKKAGAPASADTDAIPAADIEQVKPGAGMSGDEVHKMIPPHDAVPPVTTASLAPPAPAGGRSAPGTRSASPSGKTSPHSGASSFSFKFGRKKNANSNAAPGATLQDDARGRFVENMESASPSPAAGK
ncbi:hypothetical protein BJ912DRAFT_1146625 [Pholiota molesta]|nr:hypothetical protein BJ912DRAFT_1146625 [Pholiota molesta]